MTDSAHRDGPARRTFLLGAAAATLALPTVVTAPRALAAVPGTGRSDDAPILDGAEWADAAWLALPVPVRRFVYQTARMQQVTRSGTVLPIDTITPPPMVLVERDGSTSPLRRALFVGYPRTVSGADPVAPPPAWRSDPLQTTTDREVLRTIRAAMSEPENAFSTAEFGDVPCWVVVVDDTQRHGLRSDDWVGMAVCIHEWIHVIQPNGPAPADGWSPWDFSFRYPRSDSHITALAWLEHAVLAAEGEPSERLRTFIAIREHRRSRRPDLVTTGECRETSEGFATYGEWIVVREIGAVPHRLDGRTYDYPPALPEDDQRWLNFFAGEVQYGGMAVFDAVDLAIGSGWKADYCAQGGGTEFGKSLVELAIEAVGRPDPAESQRLVARAVRTHDMQSMERRIVAANLPDQDLAGPDAGRS